MTGYKSIAANKNLADAFIAVILTPDAILKGGTVGETVEYDVQPKLPLNSYDNVSKYILILIGKNDLRNFQEQVCFVISFVFIYTPI